MDLGRIKKKLEEGLQGIGKFFGNIGGGISRNFSQNMQNVQNVINRPQATPQPRPFQQSPTSTFRQPSFDFQRDFLKPAGKGVSDFFAVANPLTPSLLALSAGQSFVDKLQNKPTDIGQKINRNLDVARAFNPIRIGSDVVSTVPSSAAQFGTFETAVQDPFIKRVFGEKKAAEVRQNRQKSIRDLYGASKGISNFAESAANFEDPNSIQSQIGKTGADIASQIAAAGITKGASIPYFLQQAQGRVGRDVYESTGDINKAAIAGAAYAPAEAALEKYGVNRLFKPARSIAGAAVKGYLSEGSTEAGQQLIENLTKMAAGDKTVTSPFQNVVESGVIGGLVGAPFNVGATISAQRADAANVPPTQPPNVPPTQPPAAPNVPPPGAPTAAVSRPTQPTPPPTPPITQQPVQPAQSTLSDLDRQRLEQTQQQVEQRQARQAAGPQSTANLLENYNLPTQQTQQTDINAQVNDLNTQFPKISKPAANRLIQQYGYSRIIGLVSEVQKSGTARNLEAVVTSEAKKRFGAPAPVKQQLTQQPTQANKTDLPKGYRYASLEEIKQNFDIYDEDVMDSYIRDKNAFIVSEDDLTLYKPNEISKIKQQVTDSIKKRNNDPLWQQKYKTKYNQNENEILNLQKSTKYPKTYIDSRIAMLQSEQSIIEQRYNKEKNASQQQAKPTAQVTKVAESERLQPITAQELDVENLSNEDLSYISGIETAVRQQVENVLLPEFNNQPFTYEQMAMQIQEADRLGIDPDPQVAAFYKAKIKPFFDLLAKQSGKDIKQKEWYLPQFRTSDTYQQVNIGGNLINQLDISSFGFSTKRKNKISLEELDYSPEGIIRYAVQSEAYRLRHKTRAQQIVNEQATEPTREGSKPITIQEAEVAAVNEEKIAKKLIENSQEPGKLEETDVLSDLSEQGTLEGKSKLQIDKGPSWLSEKITSGRDAYESTPYVSSFTGERTNMYDGMGFRLYDNAEGIGNTIADITFQTDEKGNPTVVPTKQEIIEILARENRMVELNDDYKMKQYNNLADKVLNLYENADDTNRMGKIRNDYQKLQKAFAKSILYRELKTVDITNKILEKLVNKDAQRILMNDMFVQSTSEKVVNALVGVYYKGALGYNPRSAMMNLIELKRAVALFGTNKARIAMQEAATDLNITKRYGVQETKFQDVGEYTSSQDLQDPTVLQNIEKYSGLMWMFQKSEQYKDAVLLKGFEAQGRELGLEGAELTNYVLTNFNKYAVKYGQFGSVGLNKTKSGRLLFQFMQFALKEGKINYDMFFQAFGSNRTLAERKQAIAYFRRLGISNAILYVILNSILGIGWEEIFGIFNPIRNYNFDRKLENAGDWAEAGISIIPGGPFVDLIKDFALSVSDEIDRAEQESEAFNAVNIINNNIRKDLALFIPGGNQLINKTGVQGLVGLGGIFPQGAIPEMQRGYNVSAGGRARFTSPETPEDIAKALVFGQYTTSEARKYFGTNLGSDLPFFGQYLKGPKQIPVSVRYQEQIDKGRLPKEAIEASRKDNERLTKFFKDNPNYETVYKEINKTTYNPNTRKRESDVISVDKWRLVNSDKSLNLFNLLKEKALNNNKQFGDLIDPIFTLSDPQQIKAILQIRSSFTGDDIEQEEILRATQPWYNRYEELNREYGKQLASKFNSDSDYGPSERKARYFNVPYPEKSNLINQYFDLKNKDANAAKEFYKANVEQLSNDFANYKQARLNYINSKRQIEGAAPISAEVFNNVTFGYEADELKVFKELGFKLGQFGKGGRKRYTPRLYQPYVFIRSQKPGGLKVPGLGRQVPMRKGRVVVKRNQA